MSFEAIATLLIFFSAVIMLIWQPVHPALTGVLIPTLLSLVGILEPNEAFADFANPTIFFAMGLLVIGAAIFNSGLADLIGEKVINAIGFSEKKITLAVGIVASGLSAFLNDTGTTGCLMPIAAAMAKKSNIKVSKIFMSLAYFASIGGAITLVGTTPHVVASGLLEEAGYQPFGFFEFTKIGLPIAIAGLIYMYFIGVNLLPDIETDTDNIPKTTKKDPIKMVIVAIIFLFVVLAMAFEIVPMFLASVIGAILVIVTRCITIEEAFESFSMSTIFLVAGVFPLSKALVQSGAAEVIIGHVIKIAGNMSPLLFIAIITGITIFLTQFIMNTSLTGILVPLAIIVAQSMKIDPRAVVLAIAVASSGCFSSPFGTGPNLLVWDTGGYEFMDYIRVGLPLTIIYWLMTTVLIYTFYPLR